MPKHIIFGAAGTGKTTYLIKTMEELFSKGYRPEDICFCSFTRSAADEAKTRVMSKFGFKKEQLPYFGTIHSLCYKRFCLNMKVISSSDKSKFFEKKGINYDVVTDDEDLITDADNSDADGNVLMTFYDKLRVSQCTNIKGIPDINRLKTLFQEIPMGDGDFVKIFVSQHDPMKVLSGYETFKEEQKMIDFIDMLLVVLKEKWIIPTKILIVDEFQDLSPLQFRIYQLWSEGKEEVFVAGDDFQAIYSFIMASAKYLLHEKATIDLAKGDEVVILPRNFRTMKEIHDYCTDYVHRHIKPENRVEKRVIATKDGGEIIEDYINGDLEKVLEYIRPGKSTFILFRTNYYKKSFINEVLIPKGIVYHEIKGLSIWSDRAINLFNASVKLMNKEPLDAVEVDYLIKNIPFKLKLLKRGLKSSFKEMEKKDRYSVSDLIEIGFALNFFDYLEYEKFYSILDISEALKQAFLERGKSPISYPINLKIGTIHSSKGKEADDVILFKDVSMKIAREVSKTTESWESEIRVFYTGQTRPKERLVILRGGFKNSQHELIP